jgi:dipeptidyl aminopeptidase/acylaminoacyl peptidase
LIFGNPERVAPRLAPDGKAIAYLAPRDGVMNLWVRELDKVDAVPLTADRGRGIQEHGWSEDSRYLIYSQDQDGDENWRLFMVDRAGTLVFDLTPLSGVQARFLGASERHPGRILVGLNDRDPRFHDVHEINLDTRERKLVLENQLGAIGWTSDHNLNVRIATIPLPDGGLVFKHRESESSEWRELLRVPPEDAWTTSILGFSGDDQHVHLRSSIGRNSAHLLELDTTSGKERLLAGDDSADVAGIITHPTTHVVEAVGIIKARIEWRILEESIRGDFDALATARPGDLASVMRSLDDSIWLTAHTLDRGSAVYHLWDRKRSRVEKLFTARPALDNCELSEMKPISFTATSRCRSTSSRSRCQR